MKQPPTVWTPHMSDEAERRYNRGQPVAEIADSLGVSYTALRDHIQSQRKRGRFPRRLESAQHRRWTSDELAELSGLYAAKRTRIEIARALGRTKESVNSKIAELQAESALPHRNLSSHALCSSFEQDLKHMTIEEIAGKHGRKRSTIKDHLGRLGLSAAVHVRSRVEKRLREVFEQLRSVFPAEYVRGTDLVRGGFEPLLSGCLLGDASLSRDGELDMIHSASGARAQADWALTKYFALWAAGIPSRIGLKQISDGRAGCHLAIRVTTLQTLVLQSIRCDWYPDGRKRLPKSFELDDVSAAVWYGDDGYNQRGQVGFATHGFSAKDVRTLGRVVEQRYSLDLGAPRLHRKSQKLFLLSRSTRSTLKFLAAVADRIDGIPCLKRKLAPRHRRDSSRSEAIVRWLQANAPARGRRAGAHTRKSTRLL